jgi:hypothetical protein
MSDQQAIYQVWHDLGFPSRGIRCLLGLDRDSLFPQDHAHVANVRAGSLEQAFELTRDKGSMPDGAEHWQPWEENPEVEILVMPWRSTSGGDVIVDPQGNEHRVERQGFDYVEASQRGKYRLHDILRVMIKARPGDNILCSLEPPDIFVPPIER